VRCLKSKESNQKEHDDSIYKQRKARKKRGDSLRPIGKGDQVLEKRLDQKELT
jgi:hypothetical protein